MDEIENSLETVKAGIGEENDIYISLLEQAESQSSLSIKKKELEEEHVEDLNYAAKLREKVKN